MLKPFKGYTVIRLWTISIMFWELGLIILNWIQTNLETKHFRKLANFMTVFKKKTLGKQIIFTLYWDLEIVLTWGVKIIKWELIKRLSHGETLKNIKTYWRIKHYQDLACIFYQNLLENNLFFVFRDYAAHKAVNFIM